MYIFKSVKPYGLSLNLLSFLNESFAVLFSLFCSSVSSNNPLHTKLKAKFPVKKRVKLDVKENAALNIIVVVCRASRVELTLLFMFSSTAITHFSKKKNKIKTLQMNIFVIVKSKLTTFFHCLYPYWS